MEKNRNAEHRPLWLALLSEPFRLRRCRMRRAPGSAMRVGSYRVRGLYSLQLRNLYRFFDTDQVLIVRSEDLRERHDAVLRRIFAFLGVSGQVRIAPQTVNKGKGGGRKHRAVALAAETLLSSGAAAVARVVANPFRKWRGAPARHAHSGSDRLVCNSKACALRCGHLPALPGPARSRPGGKTPYHRMAPRSIVRRYHVNTTQGLMAAVHRQE